MASLSDILSTIQNGVTAINNLTRQMSGSLLNIAGQISAITSSYVKSLNGKTGIISLTVTKQIFFANGTYTPTAGMVYCIIECVGPGGGGGGTTGALNNIQCSSGGGGGAYSRLIASAATIGMSKSVTVGTGGAGGAAGSNNGSAGSADTSVGTLCVAKAGLGGTGGNNANAGGAGGAAASGTGDLKVSGEQGTGGFIGVSLSATLDMPGSRGGSSGLQFGPGAAGVMAINGAFTGQAGGLYGGGGGGGFTNNNASSSGGGAGADGIVVITEFVIA